MIIHSKVTEKNLPYHTFNLKVSQKRKELYALSPDPWEFQWLRILPNAIQLWFKSEVACRTAFFSQTEEDSPRARLAIRTRLALVSVRLWDTKINAGSAG